jgi:hypothetical protein
MFRPTGPSSGEFVIFIYNYLRGLHYKSGRQIPSEASAVWQPKDVYYEIIWMCTKASTIVRAVVVDFFFDC